ncbi:MAG TPA: tetratricopeptide repeat protein [Methanoregulaceae archaeon]|nr:tetratricopeptide repeat protein [Methanoregulaceae archaeon]
MKAMAGHFLCIIILIAAVLSIVVTPVFADTSSEIALSWVQKGDDYFQREKFNESLEAYETAVAYDPYNTLSWNKLGLARIALSDFDGGIRAFKRSIALDPFYSAPWNNLGDAFYQIGDYPAAIEAYNGALAINSNDLYALVHKGINLQKMGQSDQAVGVYEDVILIAEREVRKHPNDAKFDAGLWTNKGHALFQLGRYDEAYESYEIALKINPKYDPALEGMERVEAVVIELNGTLAEGDERYTVVGDSAEPTSTPFHGIVGTFSALIAAVLMVRAKKKKGAPPSS